MIPNRVRRSAVRLDRIADWQLLPGYVSQELPHMQHWLQRSLGSLGKRALSMMTWESFAGESFAGVRLGFRFSTGKAGEESRGHARGGKPGTCTVIDRFEAQ